MYTLRIFKNVNEIDRSHFNLGNYYNVKGPGKGDDQLGVILRIHGAPDTSPKDGYAIYQHDNAFIMTESGKTFEALNRSNGESIPEIPNETQEYTERILSAKKPEHV